MGGRVSGKISKVSVVIPYFQREEGILHGALASVLRQDLPAGVLVDVLVVDDGSPVPARLEVRDLAFQRPFRFIVIPQPNRGVAAARNAALQVIDETSQCVAFLDSDDRWHEGHLRQAIQALEQGHDLYFCDNRRDGHHASNFALGQGLIQHSIRESGNSELVALSRDALATILLRDCPLQISTLVYRREVSPDLLFDASKAHAGEDLLFFMQLAARAQRPCFSPKGMTHCGRGVNIYFGNLRWDSDGHLRRIIDNLRAHVSIAKVVTLSEENAAVERQARCSGDR